MTAEIKLLSAFKNFETVIDFDPSQGSVDFDLLKKVIENNPALDYYIAGVSSEVVFDGGYKIRLHVTYENTDHPISDVHIVSDDDELQSALCQYIGNYKKRLVIFVDGNVNVEQVIQRFAETNIVFYPNFLGYSISQKYSRMVNMSIFDFLFDYRLGKVKLQMMEQAVDDEVERIANMLFLPGMSDEAKVLLAHNYLAYTVKYTLGENLSDLELGYQQSAYGALVNKKCVCQGYAEAFKRLMDYAQIPCQVIWGQVEGKSDLHGWNVVTLNGENYHVDVTWDSNGDRVNYNYFGLKDSDLASTRKWNTKHFPKCNSAANILIAARKDIMRYKPQLLAKGVDPKILGW